MMIVVGPAQSEPILAHLLCLPRSIALLPISPLFRKNDVASKVPSNERKHSIECRLQMTITFLVIVKDPATSLPNLVRLQNGRGRITTAFENVAAIAAPLDRKQPGAILG